MARHATSRCSHGFNICASQSTTSASPEKNTIMRHRELNPNRNLTLKSNSNDGMKTGINRRRWTGAMLAMYTEVDNRCDKLASIIIIGLHQQLQVSTDDGPVYHTSH